MSYMRAGPRFYFLLSPGIAQSLLCSSKCLLYSLHLCGINKGNGEDSDVNSTLYTLREIVFGRQKKTEWLVQNRKKCLPSPQGNTRRPLNRAAEEGTFGRKTTSSHSTCIWVAWFFSSRNRQKERKRNKAKHSMSVLLNSIYNKIWNSDSRW